MMRRMKSETSIQAGRPRQDHPGARRLQGVNLFSIGQHSQSSIPPAEGTGRHRPTCCTPAPRTSGTDLTLGPPNGVLFQYSKKGGEGAPLKGLVSIGATVCNCSDGGHEERHDYQNRDDLNEVGTSVRGDRGFNFSRNNDNSNIVLGSSFKGIIHRG